MGKRLFSSPRPSIRERAYPFVQRFIKVYGYEFIPIPVGLKEMQNQSAQWLQIRREKPDYVMMWGWGAMNPGAINEAVKTRFDMNRFIGIWWSGHDDDLMVAGQKAKGYKALVGIYQGSIQLLMISRNM